MIWMLRTLQNLVINSSLSFACSLVFKVELMHASAGMPCQIYGNKVLVIAYPGSFFTKESTGAAT